MIRAEVISLIAEEPEAHGAFDRPTETARNVFAIVRSVGYNEFYAAKGSGVEPSIIFELNHYLEYKGEKIILYQGKRYRVVRTYTKGMKIEITAEEATHDS